MQFLIKKILYIDTGNITLGVTGKMIGGFLPYWMNNQTLLPWSSAIGNMNDFSYFNSPNLWLQMQMMQNPIPMPGCDFSLQNAYNEGFQLAERVNFSSNVSKTRQDISKFKQELTAILAQKDLPADKKQKLEEVKQLLEETERKMQEFIQRTQSQDMQTSKAELAALKEEIAALKQAATQAASAVADDNDSTGTSGTTGTGGATGTGDTTGTGGTTGMGGTTGTGDTTGAGGAAGTGGTTGAGAAAGTGGTTGTGGNTGTSGTSGNEPTETEKAAYKKALEICKDIFVAVDGPGTDTDKLDKAVMGINKDNVIFVLDKWLLDYQSKTGDDSLIETIYDDIFSGDDRKKYTEHILKALKEKADECGIDISPEQAVIENQLSRWWRSDSSIYQAFIDIHTKLTNIPLVEETEEQPAA